MNRGFDLAFGPDGPLAGELGSDDPSLTFDASLREVRRWPGGDVVGDDIFRALDVALAADPGSLWVGWFGYACRTDLPGRPASHGVADAVWMRVPRGAVPRGAVPRGAMSRGAVSRGGMSGRVRSWSPGRPLAHSTSPAQPVHAAQEPQPQPPPPWYAEAFAEVQRRLHAGDSYEVNLTMRDVVASSVPPAEVLDRLAALAPGAPYAGSVHHDGTWLISASPETYARVDEERMIETRPIKGTLPRLDDPAEDARAAERLATEQRFRAENLMITDLARNDLAMVCEPGSVVVPELMAVEAHGAVHQLVTTVRGHLRPGLSTVAALRELFPAGSMTGAPKQRTMEIIDRVESSPRGIYAGAYGWIAADGRADLAVVIRSLVRAPEGTWLVGTGGGITVYSEAHDEWDEAVTKTARLLAALA